MLLLFVGCPNKTCRLAYNAFFISTGLLLRTFILLVVVGEWGGRTLEQQSQLNQQQTAPKLAKLQHYPRDSCQSLLHVLTEQKPGISSVPVSQTSKTESTVPQRDVVADR